MPVTPTEGGSSTMLVSFGNPLLDITAVVQDTKLHEEYGLPQDGQLEVDEKQKELFSIVPERYPVQYSAGGCALNTSRVFSWMLGESGKVAFIGGIGNDEPAKQLQKIIEDSGVITSRLLQHPTESTGQCIAIVLEAERCLCADIGAANFCPPDHVFPGGSSFPEMLECDILYIEGYFITHSFDTSLQIAKFAREHNKLLVFNLCGSYVCENHPEELHQLLPYVDILFGFVEEYKTLEKHVNLQKLLDENINTPEVDTTLLSNLPKILNMVHSPDENIKTVTHSQNCGGNDALLNGGQKVSEKKDTATTSLNSFKSRVSRRDSFGRVIILTQGPRPLLYVSKDGLVRERTIKPLDPKDIVDTTGAGDSFVGGFLAALCKGKNLDDCIEGGVIAARNILKQKGCTLPSYSANYS